MNFGPGRAIPPSSTSTYFGVLDRGTGNPPVNQGGEEVRLNAEGAFGHNFRGVANIDYLSSFVFRLAFNDVFTQAVNSEVKSEAFSPIRRAGSSITPRRSAIRILKAPLPATSSPFFMRPASKLSSVDRQLGHSPFYWSYDAAAEGLSRSEPGFSTAALVGRFDLDPSVSLPLKFGGWSMRPELSLRDTCYTQQLATAVAPKWRSPMPSIARLSKARWKCGRRP